MLNLPLCKAHNANVSKGSTRRISPKKYDFSIEPSTFHCHLPTPPHCPQELQVSPAPQPSCLPASLPPLSPSPSCLALPPFRSRCRLRGASPGLRAQQGLRGPARSCGARPGAAGTGNRPGAAGPGPELRELAWGCGNRPGAAWPGPGLRELARGCGNRPGAAGPCPELRAPAHSSHSGARQC